ncbi:MAG: SAM-dependent methyltransferase [Polyangiaceae bacterium]
MSPRVALVDPILGPLTDDLLTPDVRVWQRARGHRFSSDDVATAFVAARARPDAARAVDLGTGLGSVLLMLAWKLRGTSFVAVEAQDPSFALLERNVARSGFADRIATLHGDFRALAGELEARGPFDLVTGTPPYFPAESCVAADDRQREYARVEHRGGVEAYVDVGARCMATDGTLVICGDARSGDRVARAAAVRALAVAETTEVIPKEGKAALFSVWVLRRGAAASAKRSLTLRGRRGETLPDADALRAFSGFPPRSRADRIPGDDAVPMDR